jgi:excisionase family DNA binding protein
VTAGDVVLMTAREVADLLGLSPNTVLDWYENGKLPGIKLGGTRGGRVRFYEHEVLTKLESWRAGSGEPDAGALPRPL